VKMNFRSYSDKLEEAANEINLKDSIKTHRKGVGGIRDKIVFYKQAFTIAETWAGIPKALVYWLALTPLAITSFNSFMGFFGMEFLEIPLDYGSLIAVVSVAFLMVFGFLAWTHWGLQRRQNELGNKQNPCYFMLYKEICKLREEIQEMKK